MPFIPRTHDAGLIATDWGGTAIELWSSPDSLAKCGVKNRYLAGFEAMM